VKTVIGRHTAFLKSFALCGSITRAAKAAGVDRSQHYEWLKSREGYREEFAEAMSQAAAVLEDEAVERATKGVYEPCVWQGQFVFPTKSVIDKKTGEERKITGKIPFGVWKKSDTLLMFLLKGLKPERYRDRVTAEVSGPEGGPIPLEDKRLRTLNDDELTQLLTLARKLATAASAGSGTEET
jgi:hypothetical protein